MVRNAVFVRANPGKRAPPRAFVRRPRKRDRDDISKRVYIVPGNDHTSIDGAEEDLRAAAADESIPHPRA